MTNNFQTIRESLDPRLITSLFKNFSDQYVALQELIDNAVDDRIEGHALLVSLVLKDDKLTIKNHNGKGMTIEDLASFFQWGYSDKRKQIGRYGQGGKAAIGYLGTGFTLKSSPMNSDHGYLIKVDDWRDRSDGLKEVNIQEFSTMDVEPGSVELTITGLQKNINPATLKERIASTYRPLICDKKVEFTVDREQISCAPPQYDEDTRQTFSREFTLDGKKYTLYGNYGIVPDTNAARGGFNIYQFGRRVGKKEYFGHHDVTKKWSMERLYGELCLDFEVPLLMNKTDADRDSELWQRIEQEMYKEIDPVAKIAIDYKAPTKKEKSAVTRISKKVQKEVGKDGIKIELANYGPHPLYKLFKDDKGKPILKINRDHQAYDKWSSTAFGKQTYAVMIYALYAATENLSKKEAAKFLSAFSDSLKEHTFKLL